MNKQDSENAKQEASALKREDTNPAQLEKTKRESAPLER